MKLAAGVTHAVISRRLKVLFLLPALLAAASVNMAWAQGAAPPSKQAIPLIVVAPPSIVKSFSAASVPLNSSVTLTFTITNPNGATDLTGVSFNDTFPSGLIIANPDSLTGTCDPGVITPSVTSINLVGGTILAGSSCTFSIDVLAIAGGTQVNTTDPVTSNEGGTGNTATASVDVPLPDLAITKTHVGNFTRGQLGDYTITVTNVGGATTTDPVTVTDTLPAGLNATAISGPGWICVSLTSCSRADTIDPGLSFPDITLTVSVNLNAPASVTNTATVSGGGEANSSNDTATDPTTTVVPDLTITKTHTGNFTRGQLGATYTITVTNSGSATTNALVTVVDTLPAGLNSTAISGPGWICASLTSCSRADALAPGLSYPAITLTVSVNFNAPLSITNTATVSGGGEANAGNDTATDVTTINPAVTSPLLLSAEILNLEVTAGGTTSTVLDVNSSIGVGTITFACSGLPAGATCSFNPASVTTLSAQVTMSVSTAGRASAIPLPGGIGVPPVYAMLFLLGLTAVCIGLVTQRRTRLAVCLGSMALICALAGCGGGTIKGTPEGTSTVTVTATGTGGTSGTTTVSLTVLRPGPVP